MAAEIVLTKSDSALVDEVLPAPNFTARRGVDAPDIILLHYTGMVDDNAALRWLACEESGVSCHYFVNQDGRIVQLVSEDMRAWHAGRSCWKGDRDINSRSMGIEIANPGHEHGYRAFGEPQMASVVALVADIAERRKIHASNILAHSDVAPMRKEDPGELFEWGQLRVDGKPIQSDPKLDSIGTHCNTNEICEARELLAKIGYDLLCDENEDVAFAGCVRAFQRRYRPQQLDGAVDLSTLETMRIIHEHFKD